MPNRNRELRKYTNRCHHRKKRHGANWRQFFENSLGMCTYQLADGSYCGCIFYLEFHAPFGEISPFNVRVLRCVEHHAEEHAGIVNERPQVNLLQEDISFEIWRCGGYEGWLEHYDITRRAVPCG